MAEAFLLQHNFKFDWSEDVETTEESAWLSIGAGITDITPAENEQIDQKYYYNKGGNASTTVIGKQTVWAFTGDRDYEDAFQNLVYITLKNKLGSDREGTLRVTYPDGAIETAHSTIANIVAPGGPANAKGAISFEIHNNAVPTMTPPTP